MGRGEGHTRSPAAVALKAFRCLSCPFLTSPSSSAHRPSVSPGAKAGLSRPGCPACNAHPSGIDYTQTLSLRDTQPLSGKDREVGEGPRPAALPGNSAPLSSQTRRLFSRAQQPINPTEPFHPRAAGRASTASCEEPNCEPPRERQDVSCKLQTWPRLSRTICYSERKNQKRADPATFRWTDTQPGGNQVRQEPWPRDPQAALGKYLLTRKQVKRPGPAHRPEAGGAHSTPGSRLPSTGRSLAGGEGRLVVFVVGRSATIL